MSIALISHGWTILSRALSHSSPKQTAATIALHLASRSTSKSIDFVDNTTKLNSPSDRFIFEDQSEDYASVARRSIPRMPSTMSRIDAELPLHLPEPVASDASIFEDFSSNDYVARRVYLREPPSSTFQALESLIRRERHEEAWALCQEMLSSGIEIPRSNVYARAATVVLSSNELSMEDRMSRCLVWLSMIPSARENREAGDKNVVITADKRVTAMRRRVFQVLQPTITPAIQFSLAIASKGYAELICPEAIVFITRYSTPSHSLRFIKEFLDADFASVADVDTKREEDLQEVRDEERLRRIRELAHRVQGPAIETLTRSGDFAAAMSLLPTSENPFRLSIRTYDLLLSRLRDTRVGSFPNYIDLVEKLRRDPSYYYEAPKSPSYLETGDWHTRTKHLKALEEELDPESPFYIGESLAVQLQSILDSIRLSNLSVPDLLAFFSDYHESERSTAITRLRKLALGRNWPTGSIFLYAEMSYYLNHALYLLVLQTYANHFYFSGVPEEEVTAAIRYLETDREIDRSHPAYFEKRTVDFRRRIPTESHTDLAWHALARAVPGRGVDELYHRFIQHQLHIRDAKAPEDATRLSFPPSIEHPIGTAVFTVFLSRLLRHDQPSRASELFHDMTKVGVNPTIHHFTLLATFYVHVGDIQRAFAVVGVLEQEHPVEYPSPMQISLETVHRQRPEPGIPTPDVIFYASLIGALVKHKYLKEAKEIRRLFHKRFIYTMYLHAPTDVALKLLNGLQYEVDKQRQVTFRAEQTVNTPPELKGCPTITCNT